MEGLQSIPRIGEKMAQRFISHFGSEREAMAAIVGADIAGISEIDGIGRRYAISLVQDVRAKAEGIDSTAFLKNNEITDIYEKLIGIIQSFASTSYARDKMNIFIPYPASRQDLIEKNRDMISGYISSCDRIVGNHQLCELLSEIKPLRENIHLPRVRDRVIVVSNPKDFSFAKERFGANIPVQLAENEREFVDVASGYSQVLAVGELFFEFSIPDEITPEFISSLHDVDESFVFPEGLIAYFVSNMSEINHAAEVARMLRDAGLSFMDCLPDIDTLQALISRIDSDGNISIGTDREVDRLAGITEHMDATVKRSLETANQQIDSVLGNSQLTLSGKDMVDIIKGEISMNELLSKEMEDSYMQILKSTKESIVAGLGLNSSESLLLDGIFPDRVAYPLEIDDSRFELFKSEINRKFFQRQVEFKRSFARDLLEFRSLVRKMVRNLLEFDVGFTIARFSRAFDMKMPVLIEDGIAFRGAKNLFLANRGFDVEAVDYSVGSTSLDPDGNKSPVVLLSGVNSGGKTSLLELIAQCTILSHMGFPVPASYFEIGLTEGINYFGKSKGTLDAGAFETTLKMFSSLNDATPKMVLVDELESITEPGASAKIIAGILEMLSENQKNTAVFVSHLSELILENVSTSIRVDGIEAEGLDSDLKLVVNRNPQYNHIAKSTPELIVEKLFKTGGVAEQQFYGRLREKFGN
ncbi:dsDNA-specific endonuclease/ATPase MutS2 [Methanohalophilus levihalophilus]|uniref:MutS-related protein n=1 Tax=Methanohalophilus levihalophilus TaxID=1431282 RepID=UPI001AE1BD6A|nr:endonuclease MutS2 [Methanohalophilus levihalophilus]MBP2030932.1 dsDNA-specific endonuclease/ATPase MutS2 [Methanohalophilus levihalophilus]